jgi:tight adherence protein B
VNSLTDTATIAAALRAGMSIADAKRRYQPNEFALRSLALCERLGSAPAENLERLAQVEVAQAKAVAELEVAASGPRASARLVTLLPAVVLLGAQLLGMRVLNSVNIFTSGSILLGALLLVGGRSWSSRILERAKPKTDDPGAALDAFAAAMNAGLPQRVAAEEVESLFGPQLQVAQLISTSAETGLAVSKLALAEADRQRLTWRIESERRIHEAGVRLMWPLGLAVLPAFVLIAVVPLAAAMLRGN